MPEVQVEHTARVGAGAPVRGRAEHDRRWMVEGGPWGGDPRTRAFAAPPLRLIVAPPTLLPQRKREP